MVLNTQLGEVRKPGREASSNGSERGWILNKWDGAVRTVVPSSIVEFQGDIPNHLTRSTGSK